MESLAHLALHVGFLRGVFYTEISVKFLLMASTVMAADGQEALQEALSRRVDLIVMDASMPEVDGLEACHCLKAMPKTQKIPVVLTISKRDPASRRLGERTHGSVRVLRKPFLPDELVSLAKQLVKRKSILL